MAAKIGAILSGRGTVSYEDLSAAARPALRHRLILNYEGQAENVRPDDVIGQILDSVARPAIVA